MSVSNQDGVIGLLGLPEGDGSCPFVLLDLQGGQASLVAGRASTLEGIVDAEVGTVPREAASRIAEQVKREHRMATVPGHVLLHVIERAVLESGVQPEAWAEVRDNLDQGLVNTARLVDPLAKQERELDLELLDRSTPLAHPKHGVFFELPHEVAEPVFGRILDILQGPGTPDERSEAIGVIVGETATAAVAGPARAAWSLGMDVVTVLSAQEGQEELRSAARHTALALRSGRAGADIPWVRVWTERQLAHAVEQLMALSRNRGPAPQPQ